MRDVSIEKMEAKTDEKRMDRVVGVGFERTAAEDSKRADETKSDFFYGWSRIICLF
ncbi:hypothetical protein [Candidatus Enterococcus clewellii]|uniref:Uncharacterized protein n=1 Tax=Candidatus Enterococcus clewellii TaxID=1834193 RepID=A0A242K3I4_9ENTE|nr:hypothetical protein [Enterococcus sp. 9E7_DIV0242]OTP13557.1 hypothetical protein A5888_003035 [Enterococcus sp. 9E7_DIV0242]